MNKYLLRAVKILTFVFLIITCDRVIGFFLNKYYFTQKSGFDRELRYILKEGEPDIFIVGNSRARRHYDSRLLKDSLKMSCYNSGIEGGMSLLMSYAIIISITERYTPKMIILEYNPDHNLGPGFYNRLSILLPYYLEYNELRPIILLRSPYEKFKLLSSIYSFNSDLFGIIRFNTDKFGVKKSDFDGFAPFKYSIPDVNLMKKEIEKEREMNKQYDNDVNVTDALRKIILLCREKNIELYIVNSPVYHSEDDKAPHLTRTAELSFEIMKQLKANYYDFSNDSVCNSHPEWFNDFNHLNENGAYFFTNQLIEKIKKSNYYLKNN
jgi:hypothetical protein